jgi:hypothetical protein
LIPRWTRSVADGCEEQKKKAIKFAQSVMIPGEEGYDIVGLKHDNDDFVPLLDEILQTEVEDVAPDFLVELYGTNDGFQTRTVITTSEIMVKESELMFPSLT